MKKFFSKFDCPSGWASISLGEILPLSYGKSLTNRCRVQEGLVDVLGSSGVVGKHDVALTNSETIVVGRKGNAGNVIYSKFPCWPIDTTFYVEPSRQLNSVFCFQLLYFLRLGELDQSTAIPSLSRDNYSSILVYLPPGKEQARVASRIEELFSELDKGEESLRRAQAQLKRYRQSVLKAAVTGELTRVWRERNADKLESGEALLRRILKARQADGPKTRVQDFAPGKNPLGELPDSWARVRIDAVGDVQLGRQRAPRHHTGEHMRPYLRVANVYEERIDISDVMEMNFTPDEYHTYILKRGDILLNEGQSAELVGRPAIFNDELPGACFTNTLVRFRAYAGLVLPEYALAVFLYYFHAGVFKRIAKITTNIAHLGAGRFSELALPLPSIEEQSMVVQELDRIRSGIDAIAKEIGTRLQSGAALRQSILKSAFSGKLVPQNPNDEPASELLRRIAAERAAQEKRPAKSVAPRTPSKPRKARASVLPSAPAPAASVAAAPPVAGSGLAAVRKAAGLSQAQLAARAGINQAYVSQMETGKRAITAEQAVALARALGVAPEKLR